MQAAKISSFLVFALGIIYLAVTLIGFSKLERAGQPIGQPFFGIMEVLIILIAPLMAISMVGVHRFAESRQKTLAAIALGFMIAMAMITITVHALTLTVGQEVSIGRWRFSLAFRWPSVGYALDILAWDWFYALAILFAVPVFNKGKLEKAVKTLMIISGVLSLAGLTGIPLNNMQFRNIGIIGYGLIGPVVFLLIGLVIRRENSSAAL